MISIFRVFKVNVLMQYLTDHFKTDPIQLLL